MAKMAERDLLLTMLAQEYVDLAAKEVFAKHFGTTEGISAIQEERAELERKMTEDYGFTYAEVQAKFDTLEADIEPEVSD